MSNLFDLLSLYIVAYAILNDVEHTVLKYLGTLYIVTLYILHAGYHLLLVEDKAHAARCVVRRADVLHVCLVCLEVLRVDAIEAYTVLVRTAQYVAVSHRQSVNRRNSRYSIHTFEVIVSGEANGRCIAYRESKVLAVCLEDDGIVRRNNITGTGYSRQHEVTTAEELHKPLHLPAARTY